MSFFDNVIQLFDKGLVDQDALNKHFVDQNCTDIRQYIYAKITSFDLNKFPNGCFAFKEFQFLSSDVVCIHANFLIGEQDKIDALALCGRWYLTEGPSIFRKIKFYLKFIKHNVSWFLKISIKFFIGLQSYEFLKIFFIIILFQTDRLCMV